MMRLSFTAVGMLLVSTLEQSLATKLTLQSQNGRDNDVRPDGHGRHHRHGHRHRHRHHGHDQLADQEEMTATETQRSLLAKRRKDNKDLVFAHLAKCGGTTAKVLVVAAVPGTMICDELTALGHCERPEGAFTIALARNPFNMLASLWDYYAHDHGEMADTESDEVKTQFLRPNSTHLGKSQKDRHSFGEWVHHYSTEKLGLASARFAAKYLRDDINPVDAFASPVHHPEIFSTMASFHKANVADCWVLTDSMEQDLVRCLQQYQNAGGVVDFHKFEEATKHERDNHGHHVSCWKLFEDDDLRGFVAKSEGALLREFGFPDHCS